MSTMVTRADGVPLRSLKCNVRFRRTASRQEEIPHGDGERAVFAARDDDAIELAQACVRRAEKKREVVEAGLGMLRRRANRSPR